MGEKTNIGKHCVIWPNTIIINIKTGDNVTLGLPILKDSQLDDGSATGATAELNRAKLGRRVKDFHHSYLGDAEVGDDSNIGAGTITANYDGINKNKTVLGPGTFTGINSNIIAPNELPEGSYIAAGATVTKNLKERRRLPPFSLIFSLLQLDIRPRKDREPQNA
jgi:bifunctional UDP-N-acetylglucosamine pyrophosphorylase/glucosamine-1-phosphate N-acetyltransferase